MSITEAGDEGFKDMTTSAEANLVVTLDEAAQVRVLSDGVLYDDARNFVAKHCTERYPKPAQIQGLLEYSNDWNTLLSFVKHQADDRDQHADKDFYQALKKWLNEFRGRVQNELGFTFSELPKDQLNKRLAVFCGLLAQDFIQHLAAELRYQSAINKR
jgi:DMSO/TMAO reductase YedYZ molybdopterin-dependent catalytic subunit